jgi:hypothetical protein
MAHVLRAAALVVVCAVMGGGVGEAFAAEIVQREFKFNIGVTACVEVLNEHTIDGQPIVSSDCGVKFDSNWHWGPNNVISGIGTNGAGTTCMAATGRRLVVLVFCSDPAPPFRWSFDSGQIIVRSGPNFGLCLDSQGRYGPTASAQLVVAPCSGSPTQLWAVK